MWLCEGKLNRKTAHFRLPYVPHEHRLLKLPTRLHGLLFVCDNFHLSHTKANTSAKYLSQKRWSTPYHEQIESFLKIPRERDALERIAKKQWIWDLNLGHVNCYLINVLWWNFHFRLCPFLSVRGFHSYLFGLSTFTWPFAIHWPKGKEENEHKASFCPGYNHQHNENILILGRERASRQLSERHTVAEDV